LTTSIAKDAGPAQRLAREVS